MKFQSMKKIVGSLLSASVIASTLSPLAASPVSAADDIYTTRTDLFPYRNVMYYGDYSVYDGQRKAYAETIPAESITHLNFAFMDFNAAGDLEFTDIGSYVAMSTVWQGYPGNASGGTNWEPFMFKKGSTNELYTPEGDWEGGNMPNGLMPVFNYLKSRNANLRLGISFGGWSRGGDFTEMAANETARKNFVENVIDFMEYTDFDVVDVDWEYPNFVREGEEIDIKGDEGTPNANPADKENYIILLQDLRDALDKLSEKTNKYYELSVAVPASPVKLAAGIDVKKMFEIIDFGNMMTYDLRGSFDHNYTGHQTNLYGNPLDPVSYEAKYSIDQIVEYMIDEGAPSHKIVIGCAFYTRGWGNVQPGTEVDGVDTTKTPGLFAQVEVSGKNASTSTSEKTGVNDPLAETEAWGALNSAPLLYGSGGYLSGVFEYRAIRGNSWQGEAKIAGQLQKITYNTVDSAFGKGALEEYWDDVAKAPYLYGQATADPSGFGTSQGVSQSQKGNYIFLTYDNERSIAEKGKYVKEKGLGGMIAWQASGDATASGMMTEQNQSTEKRDVLTKAMLQSMYGTKSLNQYSIPDTTLNLQTTVSDGKFSVKNNETVKETDRKVFPNFSNPTITMDWPGVMSSNEALRKVVKYPTFIVNLKEGATLTENGSDIIKAGTDFGPNAYMVSYIAQDKDNASDYHKGFIIPSKTANLNVPGMKADDVEWIDMLQSIVKYGDYVFKQRVYSSVGSKEKYIIDFELEGQLQSTIYGGYGDGNGEIIVVMPSTQNIVGTPLEITKLQLSGGTADINVGDTKDFTNAVPITVTAEDGSTKTYNITVINVVQYEKTDRGGNDVTGIEVTNPTDGKITVKVGETFTIEANATGNGSFNPEITFTSADSSIARVNAGTGVVTGVEVGTTTVTITSDEDSTIQSVITVEVVDDPAGGVPVMLGDVDDSGDIGVNDALYLFKAMAGIEELDDLQRFVGDITQSGETPGVNEALSIFKSIASVDYATGPDGIKIGEYINYFG